MAARAFILRGLVLLAANTLFVYSLAIRQGCWSCGGTPAPHRERCGGCGAAPRSPAVGSRTQHFEAFATTPRRRTATRRARVSAASGWKETDVPTQPAAAPWGPRRVRVRRRQTSARCASGLTHRTGARTFPARISPAARQRSLAGGIVASEATGITPDVVVEAATGIREQSEQGRHCGVDPPEHGPPGGGRCFASGAAKACALPRGPATGVTFRSYRMAPRRSGAGRHGRRHAAAARRDVRSAAGRRSRSAGPAMAVYRAHLHAAARPPRWRLATPVRLRAGVRGRAHGIRAASAWGHPTSLRLAHRCRS